MSDITSHLDNRGSLIYRSKNRMAHESYLNPEEFMLWKRCEKTKKGFCCVGVTGSTADAIKFVAVGKEP